MCRCDYGADDQARRLFFAELRGEPSSPMAGMCEYFDEQERRGKCKPRRVCADPDPALQAEGLI